MSHPTTRQARTTARRLRRAEALLLEAERALHDLPDHHCPRDLLERIRIHNAARTPALPKGDTPA
ncbi:hypothetical protein [Xanthomonas sp. XNM01]|uniref:hypothetical protein n=1 Tax=Xanthomonas sp. XNM01 TaxID=2769289 RepID=UPI001781FCC2|nr:hypothetical protein [Xanthomonas sp. XNM01]MBD9368822.1 hypothetical protein [Xanthomonas sp. XNM01]